MAEKITERKEYRGLGYAPAISVPGLIEERPVAATRPPATNQLTKLAKSLSDFGEVFVNAKLRESARVHEEHTQAGKEAAAAIQKGDNWIPPLPGTSDQEGYYVGGRIGALLKGSDEEARIRIPEELIPKEATPAFYSALRRNLASVAVAEYNAELLDEVGRVALLSEKLFTDTGVPKDETIRNAMDEVKERFEKEYGYNWAVYAPDKVLEAEALFITNTGRIGNKNRKQELLSSSGTLIREALAKSLTPEELQEVINEQIFTLEVKGAQNKVEIEAVITGAGRAASTQALLKGNPAHASNIIGRLRRLKDSGGKPLLANVGELDAMLDSAQTALARRQEKNIEKAWGQLDSRISAAIGENKGEKLSSEQLDAIVEDFLKTPVGTGAYVDGKEIMQLPEKLAEDGLTFSRNATIAKTKEKYMESGAKTAYEQGLINDVQQLIGAKDFAGARKMMAEKGNNIGAAAHGTLSRQIFIGEGYSEILNGPSMGKVEQTILNEVQVAKETDPADRESRAEALKLVELLKPALRKNVLSAYEAWIDDPANKEAIKSADDRQAAQNRILADEWNKLKEKYLPQEQANLQKEELRAAEKARRGALPSEPPFGERFGGLSRWPWPIIGDPAGLLQGYGRRAAVEGLAIRRNNIRKQSSTSVVGVIKSNPEMAKSFKASDKPLDFYIQHILPKTNPREAKALANDYNEIADQYDFIERRAWEHRDRLMEEATDPSLDRDAKPVIFKQLYETIRITGVRPTELMSGQVTLALKGGAKRVISLKDIMKEAEVAKLNPYEIPFFRNNTERRLINQTEPEKIIKMVEALEMEPTRANIMLFLNAQKSLLQEIPRSRIRIK